MLTNAPRFALLALFGAVFCSGCIFANVTVPLAYRSATPSDVGGIGHLGAVTEGHACSHLVLGLVAWGDGGFAAAMEHASAHAALAAPTPAAPSEGAMAPAAVPALLADVQADTSALNIFGLYQRRCTVIHAKVVQ